jgi:hypothetical protein
MRCLLKVSIPVLTGNATISDGSLSKTIESILADLKPEAAYFAEDRVHILRPKGCVSNPRRGGTVVSGL